jgi:predicted nucleic acid-binding Zn ribbon protein
LVKRDSRDDDPLESDQDPSDTLDVIDCPICRQSIVEDADVCPRCGNFVLRDESAGERRPTWWILLVIMLMIGLIGFAAWR